MSLQATAAQATAEPEPATVRADPAKTPSPVAAKAEAGDSAVPAAKKLSKAAAQRIKAAKAVSVARKQVGDPYRWGGSGPGAFDCSGLVQFSWKKAGVRLPRVTYSQYARIKKKVSFKNLRPGDLMFFRGKGHVGMYVGDGKMVHSPSSGKTVRVEKLSGWRKASFSGAVRPGL
ncbi:glycoside hydrolase [Spongiactinospora rosea]|uniref:Glycoside hydrolase n=1 Tax=Spongiactinospora rosea TaxID=2248750 RepID=A0A366M367_9ACTN|nr:C40 family peptidase [Spongiactinospora rosea]RBQ20243.1 glycoside hydrolase [Spongiactinospora rosea]